MSLFERGYNMKASVYKKFKQAIIESKDFPNAPIWCAGFHFLALTERQAEDLRLSTLDRWGDENGVVHFPNGISIKP